MSQPRWKDAVGMASSLGGYRQLDEPLVGFRVLYWSTAFRGFMSANEHYRWLPGVNHAQHSEPLARSAQDGKHNAPKADCSCGFWLLSRPENLHKHHLGWYQGFVVVVAKVWGRVILHELGARGEYAQVLAVAENSNHYYHPDHEFCKTLHPTEEVEESAEAILLRRQMSMKIMREDALAYVPKAAEEYNVPVLPTAGLIPFAKEHGRLI